MKKVILLFLLVIYTGMLYSQGWTQYLPDGREGDKTLTFYDYEDAFNKWCKELKIDNTGYYYVNGKKIKAYGWKQFKRWEIEMEGLYDPGTGEIYNFNVLKEYEKYKQMYGPTDAVNGDWTAVAFTAEGAGNYGNGRINCVAYHPSDVNSFWVGTPWGGIWSTEDYGATWTPLSDDIGHIGIGSIAIPSDYATSHTIYLGTGDRGYNTDEGVGVFKSTDEGATWLTTGLSNNEISDFYVNRILIDPTNNNVIYAATSIGVCKSWDAGSTWDTVKTCWAADMEFRPGNPQVLYVSTRKEGGNVRIYRTLNGGQTWTQELYTTGIRMELAVSAADTNRLYALVAKTDGSLRGVYESVNGGGSYFLRYDGDLPNHNILNGDCSAAASGGQGSYDLCIAANPLDADEVYVGGINVWKSTDHGISWTIVVDGYNDCSGPNTDVHVDQHWLDFHPSNNDLFLTNDGGIFFSDDDGSSFENISGGLMINQPYRVAASQQTDDKILMGMQDNGSALWESSTLDYVNGGDGNECRINAINDNIQYTSCNANMPVLTLDNWSSSQAFSVTNDSSASWFKPIILDPPSTVYFGLTNIWKSTNNGQSFSLWWNSPDNATIRDLVISHSNPSVMYTYNNQNFYKTTNGGANWQNITANLPFVPGAIYRIEVKHDDPDVVWVTNPDWSTGGVFRSGDGGLTWSDISAGLPNHRWFDIIQNDLQPGYEELYVAGYFGVFLKLGENPWTPFNDGLPNLMCFDIDVHYDGSNSKIIAGTHGRGVWSTSLFSTDANTPATWTGRVSSYWGDINNWLLYRTPGSTNNVTIPAGCPNYPDIHGYEDCNKLTIEAGAQVTVSQSQLDVRDSLILYGTMNFTGNAANLVVYGNVVIHPGFNLNITDPNLEIYAYKHWKVLQGADFAMTKGKVIFKGSDISYISIPSSGCSFNKITIDKNSGAKVYVSEASTGKLIVSDTLNILTGNYFQNLASTDTEINSCFLNAGTYKFFGGTFKYMGGSMSLSSNTDCFFNTFRLANSACIFTLVSDMNINGDLMITSGTLDPQSYTINLKGDWLRYVSTGFFDHTTGRVEFTGSSEQTITNSEEFNIIELNKSGNSLLIDGANVACAHYDWTAGTLAVESGSFTANDLSDDGIFGNYNQSGGTIDLYNAEYLDLNGLITISAGTFNVHGGFRASYWPWSSHAGLTMSGGTLDFTDQSIYLNETSFLFTDIITGGVIRTAGSFGGTRHDFNPAGGIIELYSDNTATLSHGIGSSFYAVKINKSAAAYGPGHSTRIVPGQSFFSKTEKANAKPSEKTFALPDPSRPVHSKTKGRVDNDGTLYPSGIRSTCTTVISTLDVDDDVTIAAGELDISDQIVDLEGDLLIHGMLTMTDAAGELHVGRNVELYSTATENITGGNIYFGGSWWAWTFSQQHISGTNVVTADGDSIQNIFFSGNETGFENLVIDKPASYVVIDNTYADTLNIFGYLHVNSGNTIKTLRNCRVKVDSLFLVQSGATVDLEGNSYAIATTELQLDGTMNLNSNPKMYCKNIFSQGSTGHLVINGGSFINDAPYTGAMNSFSGITDLNGGNFEITNNGILLGTGCMYNFNGGSMRIGWSFWAPYTTGSFQPSQGTVELIGNRAADIKVLNGNYFHNLLINKGSSYEVYLSDSLIVNNDLNLTSGSLNTLGKKLVVNNDVIIGTLGKLNPSGGEVSVLRNWTNNRGTVGFSEDNSTVTFHGLYNSTLNTSETFHNLKVNKPGVIKNFFVANGTICTIEQNFSILMGAVKPGDNTTFNITGDLILSDDAGFDAAYGSPVIINLSRNWIDYNTNYSSEVGFNPGTSTVNFIGNQEAIFHNGRTGNFYNMTINKTNESVMTQSDFLVMNDFNLASGILNDDNPGLTYEFRGDMTIQADGEWQDNTATIKFSGADPQAYTNASTTSQDFRYIIIDKALAKRDNYIILASDLACTDTINVNEGELRLAGHTVECGKLLKIISGGIVSAKDNSTIKIGDSGKVDVAGGALTITGTYPGNSLLTHISTGYYTFTVNSSGSIQASDAIFEYMDDQGVNVTSTGLISSTNPFYHCTFRNGEPSGTLLCIDNTQELKVQEVEFPANTWSGSYNVSKNLHYGQLTFLTADGSYAGPAYEYDPWDRITWAQVGTWDGDTDTNWHVATNWKYDVQPTSVNNIVIPDGCSNYPHLNPPVAAVHSLYLENGAFLSILDDSLMVQTCCDLHGHLEIKNDAFLYTDSIVWQPGSSGNLQEAALIYINGSMLIQDGSKLDTLGNYRFYGSNDSRLICNADSVSIGFLYNYKPAGYSLILDGNGLGRLTIHRYYSFMNAGTLQSLANQVWVFKSQFRNPYGGHFYCNNGTFRFEGTVGISFRPNTGDYFPTMDIATTAHIDLKNTYSDTLSVKGDLIFNPPNATSGLNGNAFRIVVYGDWINNVGTAAFTAGTSKVMFMHPANPQEVQGNTSFYDILTSNSMDGRVKFYGQNSVQDRMWINYPAEIYGDLTVNNLNNDDAPSELYLMPGCNVAVTLLEQGGKLVNNGGYMTVSDLTEGVVHGNYQINDGLVILNQDPAQDLYMSGTFSFTGGELRLAGGGGYSYWPATINAPMSLDMIGGILNLAESQLVIQSNHFTENISGGTIKSYVSFVCADSVNTFHPTGGTVEITGDLDGSITMGSANCWFNNLYVNTDGAWTLPETNLKVKNEFRVISGLFDMNNHTIDVGP